MRKTEDRSLHAAHALLSAASVGALLSFSWRGWYARYLTDDYCTAALVRDLGFFKAMAHHREHWSGRFSYFPLKGLLEMIGPQTAQWTPTVLIVLLCVASLTTTRLVLRSAPGIARAALVFTFVLAYLAAAPSLTNIGGALYWETGSVTYTTPLILFILWAALFVRPMPTVVAMVSSAALMFVAGGLSETSLAGQGAMTGTALVLATVSRSHRAARVAAAGLVASIAALAVVASAPGNSVRAQVDVVSHTPLEAIVRCIAFANDFIGNFVFAGGLPILPFVVVAFVLGALIQPAPSGRVAGAVALVATAGYVGSFLPSALLLSTGPPERALDVAHCFVVVAVAATAFAAGARTRRMEIRFATALLLLAAVTIPPMVVRTNLGALPHARRIAAGMDRTDALLRVSQGKPVTLRAPWAIQQRIFDGDPSHWSNICISRFYRLQSFHAIR